MRRIVKAKIKFLSLVPKGANKFPVIYKADDGSFEWATIIKTPENFEDQGELTAVVYAPEQRDSQGDIASGQVIKEMAYEFQREGGAIDILHDGKPIPKDKAFVAETFIVQKNDPRFSEMTDYSGKKVDVTDAWAVVMKIEDKALRKLFKEENWNGISMGGTAEVLQEKSTTDSLEDLLKSFVKRYGNKKDDIDMTPEELIAALAKNNEALIKALKPEAKPEPEKKPHPEVKVDLNDAEAVKKHLESLEKKDEKKDDAPEYKGDWTDVEALAKHQRELQIWKIRKETDTSDPEQVAKMIVAITALAKGDDEETLPDENDPDFLKKQNDLLQRKLAKLNKTSKQPTEDELLQVFGSISLTKEEMEGFNEGGNIAKIANAARGFETK
jgi:hypothetical protein